MDHELMYVVINGEAIMLENGSPVSYLVDEDDGTIDWTAGDTVDWDGSYDFDPNEEDVEYVAHMCQYLTLAAKLTKEHDQEVFIK